MALAIPSRRPRSFLESSDCQIVRENPLLELWRIEQNGYRTFSILFCFLLEEEIQQSLKKLLLRPRDWRVCVELIDFNIDNSSFLAQLTKVLAFLELVPCWGFTMKECTDQCLSVAKLELLVDCLPARHNLKEIFLEGTWVPYHTLTQLERLFGLRRANHLRVKIEPMLLRFEHFSLRSIEVCARNWEHAFLFVKKLPYLENLELNFDNSSLDRIAGGHQQLPDIFLEFAEWLGSSFCPLIRFHLGQVPVIPLDNPLRILFIHLNHNSHLKELSIGRQPRFEIADMMQPVENSSIQRLEFSECFFGTEELRTLLQWLVTSVALLRRHFTTQFRMTPGDPHHAEIISNIHQVSRIHRAKELFLVDMLLQSKGHGVHPRKDETPASWWPMILESMDGLPMECIKNPGSLRTGAETTHLVQRSKLQAMYETMQYLCSRTLWGKDHTMIHQEPDDFQ